MNKAIISVENLSKNYFIGKNISGTGLPTLRDFLSYKMNSFFAKEKNKNEETSFWALKDVSFEIKQGDIVGIIGKNGAGKSTLLKILSRITYPTTGKIIMRGSVSSLLEVGTGFNPDLTGRENIYLNGAIMGMKKAEINDKFNSIVEFSGIEEFIDTPVKRYSSGMYTRLAFSISSHLEPDILIIDEVLAVGDSDFQKKCIKKMSEIAAQGRTVLFVSHDLNSIKSLCTKGILLRKGTVEFNGNIADAIRHYDSDARNHYESNIWLNNKVLAEVGASITNNDLAGSGNNSNMSYQDFDGSPETEKISELEEIPEHPYGIPQKETGLAIFTEFKLSELERTNFKIGEDVHIDFSLLALQETESMIFSISIYNSAGDWVVGITSHDSKIFWSGAEPDEVKKGRFILDNLCLAPDDYIIAIGSYSLDYSICYALTDICLPFSVRADFPTWGKFIHPCQWEIVD